MIPIVVWASGWLEGVCSLYLPLAWDGLGLVCVVCLFGYDCSCWLSVLQLLCFKSGGCAVTASLVLGACVLGWWFTGFTDCVYCLLFVFAFGW